MPYLCYLDSGYLMKDVRDHVLALLISQGREMTRGFVEGDDTSSDCRDLAYQVFKLMTTQTEVHRGRHKSNGDSRLSFADLVTRKLLGPILSGSLQVLLLNREVGFFVNKPWFVVFEARTGLWRHSALVKQLVDRKTVRRSMDGSVLL